MKILLLGASGFFGRPLAVTLAHRGDTLHIVTRSTQRREVLGVIPNARLIEGDGTKSGAWQHHVQDVDAVIHLSAPPLFDAPWPEVEDHYVMSKVRAAAELAQAIKDAPKAPRVVLFASSAAVYGTRSDVVDERAQLTDGPFSDGFRRAEDALVSIVGKTRVVALRFGTILGPGGGWLDKMKSTDDLPDASTDGFSWVHMDDAISSTLLALEKPVRGAFNVTSPEHTDVATLVATMSARLKKGEKSKGWKLFGKKTAHDTRPVVFTGQRARPASALALGYQFKHHKLDAALSAIGKHHR